MTGDDGSFEKGKIRTAGKAGLFSMIWGGMVLAPHHFRKAERRIP
jgi:hypothetical protein